MIAENSLDRLGLIFVVEIGRGAVCVDVLHFRRFYPGVVDGHLHASGGPFAVGGRGGHVVSVSGGAEPDYFGIYPGAARASEIEIFDNQYAGTFTQYEAVPF